MGVSREGVVAFFFLSKKETKAKPLLQIQNDESRHLSTGNKVLAKEHNISVGHSNY